MAIEILNSLDRYQLLANYLEPGNRSKIFIIPIQLVR